MDPSISAYEALNGQFRFKDTPLGPPGAAVVVLDRPNERPTWAPHGCRGFYIGPALGHHKCYRLFVTKTLSTRVSDSVYWIPAELSPPIPTDKEMLAIAIQDLKDTAEDLQKSQNPIGGWRKAILDRASAIDEYISLYHPILHRDSEAYTIFQLNRPDTDLVPPEEEKIEIDQLVDPKPPDEEDLPSSSTKHVSWSPSLSEVAPDPPAGGKFDSAEKFIEYITRPTNDPTIPSVEGQTVKAQAQLPIESEDRKALIKEKTRSNPRRSAGAPKHLQNYHCYSLLEYSLIEDKPDDRIGLDEAGDPLPTGKPWLARSPKSGRSN